MAFPTEPDGIVSGKVNVNVCVTVQVPSGEGSETFCADHSSIRFLQSPKSDLRPAPLSVIQSFV